MMSPDYYWKIINHLDKINSKCSVSFTTNLWPFYKNPEKIVGKVINVQYFEETINKEGEISLRFPTFKYLFGEVREF